MHNYVHHRSKLPVIFSTYFEENKVIHKYNTRQKGDFHIDVINSEIGKRGIKYNCTYLLYFLTCWWQDTWHTCSVGRLLVSCRASAMTLTTGALTSRCRQGYQVQHLVCVHMGGLTTITSDHLRTTALSNDFNAWWYSSWYYEIFYITHSSISG